MKKTIVLAVALVASIGVFAGPRGGHHHGGHRGGPAIHHHGGHHHGGGVWGHGGRNFWPGFVGGVIGGAIADAVVTPHRVVYHHAPPPVVVPAPVVVQTPVVVPQPVVVQQPTVWVEGRYVDQVQGNGVVVRVWQPGHYESRPVYYP